MLGPKPRPGGFPKISGSSASWGRKAGHQGSYNGLLPHHQPLQHQSTSYSFRRPSRRPNDEFLTQKLIVARSTFKTLGPILRANLQFGWFGGIKRKKISNLNQDKFWFHGNVLVGIRVEKEEFQMIDEKYLHHNGFGRFRGVYQVNICRLNWSYNTRRGIG
jgi:hypothetical protein